MHRIDTDGNVANQFSDGTPGVTQATVVDDDWLNAVQEEICNAVVMTGLTLNKAAHNQLWSAITAQVTAPPTIHYPGTGSEPAFASGVANASGAKTAFFKQADGTVTVSLNVSTPSGTSHDLFTLPVGFRPGATVAGSGTTNGGNCCFVMVDATGLVRALGPTFTQIVSSLTFHINQT